MTPGQETYAKYCEWLGLDPDKVDKLGLEMDDSGLTRVVVTFVPVAADGLEHAIWKLRVV